MPLSSDGLETPTQEEIADNIRAALLASSAVNPRGDLNLESDSLLGVIVDIFSDKLAEAYQVMQAVHAGQYRSSAEGASLDALAELVGATRLPATASTVELTVSGAENAAVPTGTRFRDDDRVDIEWVSTTSGTITGGVATVQAQASETGAISANAGTITTVVTPLAGIDGVTNAADATLGRALETDAALRARMAELVFAPGSSTAQAIRAAVLAVAGVTEAYVYENATDATNAYGVPAHAIEVVVAGGDDDEVAQAIYENKAAGIATYSATSDGATVQDVNGASVDIEFSRPVDVDVYVYVEVEVDDSNADAESEIKEAIAALGDQATVGSKVIRSKFFAPAYSVDGVVNVRRMGVSDVDAAGAEAAATTLDDIDMAFRERAVFDTTRIEVVLV